MHHQDGCGEGLDNTGISGHGFSSWCGARPRMPGLPLAGVKISMEVWDVPRAVVHPWGGLPALSHPKFDGRFFGGYDLGVVQGGLHHICGKEDREKGGLCGVFRFEDRVFWSARRAHENCWT